jgi:hypothetical protein
MTLNDRIDHWMLKRLEKRGVVAIINVPMWWIKPPDQPIGQVLDVRFYGDKTPAFPPTSGVIK